MPNYAQAAIQIRHNKERRAKMKEILKTRNIAVSSLLREETRNPELKTLITIITKMTTFDWFPQ